MTVESSSRIKVLASQGAREAARDTTAAYRLTVAGRFELLNRIRSKNSYLKKTYTSLVFRRRDRLRQPLIHHVRWRWTVEKRLGLINSGSRTRRILRFVA